MDNMGFETFAILYGKPDQPEAERAANAAVVANKERAAGDLERAAALKDRVAQQIQQGHPPQYVLYTALKCIGLLSHDEPWADDLTAKLEAVYDDLAQESLLDDQDIIAGERLQAQATEYREKLRTQLKKTTSGLGRIYGDLKAALEVLEGMD